MKKPVKSYNDAGFLNSPEARPVRIRAASNLLAHDT